MKNLFFCEKTHSRWLILTIDFFIISLAFIMSALIVHKFQYQEMLKIDFLIFLSVNTLVTLMVFVFMRIDTGIIRYSNIEDIFRIFKAVSLSSICFLIISKFLIIPFLHLNLELLNASAVVNFFIVTTLLIVLIISVKSLYAYLKEDLETANSETILIYGSDKKAILIKQAFEYSQEKKYKIIGFIDDFHDRINKNIEQKKVYPSSSIHLLKQKYSIDKMVIMADNLNEANKNIAIKKCIDLGISVISVPHSTQWVNGKLSLNQVRNLNIEDLLQREPINLQKDNIFRELSGKRILVTGAAGSIGSEIVRQLLNYQPESVILCDQAETPLHEIQLEIEDHLVNAPTKIFMANIQNAKRLRTLFSTYRPQIIFHAAAFKHVSMMEDNPCEAILTNVLGTKNLADISLDFKVEKFIMISTDKAVNPTNIMGASKRLAEMYIQSLNFHQIRNIPVDETSNTKVIPTRFITTRFGNVLGSNGSVVPRFKSQIEKGGPVTITHPQITRFFMTIPESVQLVLEACAMGKGGEIFIFDMGNPIKIFDMAVNMIRLAGLVPEKDIKIIYTGLRPGEKLYEELLNKGENIIPTHHAKIKISKVIDFHFFYVKKMIDELLDLNELDDNDLMVSKLKEIVPEFKSNNSIYNKLDATGTQPLVDNSVVV